MKRNWFGIYSYWWDMYWWVMRGCWHINKFQKTLLLLTLPLSLIGAFIVEGIFGGGKDDYLRLRR